MRNLVAVSFVFVVVVLGSFEKCNAGKMSGGLQMDFYEGKCSGVEDTVRVLTWRNVSDNPKLPAKLLRLHFHDCFVRGCDGSVLLDSTSNNTAEKEALPNLSLSGFEFIDFVKSVLEDACPEIVSCADILTLATRDAVSFQFQRSMWPVLTGRKDGRISISTEALDNLPSPFSDFQTLLASFKSKSRTFDIVDLVALSGAHTLGETHCDFMAPRLYNFTGNGDTDPSLDAAFAENLKTICPNPIDPAQTLEMDPGSSTNFDSQYFVGLKQNKAAFLSDVALLTNRKAARIATQFQDPQLFLNQFGLSMKKLGGVGVLTGSQGEIRQKCRVVNP